MEFDRLDQLHCYGIAFLFRRDPGRGLGYEFHYDIIKFLANTVNNLDIANLTICSERKPDPNSSFVHTFLRIEQPLVKPECKIFRTVRHRINIKSISGQDGFEISSVPDLLIAGGALVISDYDDFLQNRLAFFLYKDTFSP